MHWYVWRPGRPHVPQESPIAFSETGSLMETWAQQSGYVGQKAPERDLPVFKSQHWGYKQTVFMMWEKQTLVLVFLWKALYGHSYFPSLV